MLLQWILIALAAAFAVLTVLVKLTRSLPIDLRITHAIQASHAPLFGAVMSGVSWAGNFPQVLLLMGAIALLLYALGLQWECLMSLLAGAGGDVINVGVKFAIQRSRPTPDLVHVVSHLKSYSFPSGHVMFFLCYFGFLWFLSYSLLKVSPKRTVLLVVLGLLIVLIGPSRIYLGAHWASDVLGAYLLGILVLGGIIHAYRWGKTRFFVEQPVAPAPNKA